MSWYFGIGGYHHGSVWWDHHYGLHSPIIVLPLWFSLWDSYYPGCYSYYGYPGYDGYSFGDYYGYGDAYAALPAAPAEDLPAEAAGPADPTPDVPADPPAAAADDQTANPPDSTADSPEAEAGRQFHADAVSAFRRRDYREAARLANHAVIERPRDGKVHEVLSLALFAAREYRGAAMEAHAAVALGTLSDWPTLYGYYNDLPSYEKQLEALAQYVGKNPTALDARFLLAYHDLMLGHPREAKDLLGEIVAKVPKDKQAAELLQRAEKALKTAGKAKAK